MHHIRLGVVALAIALSSLSFSQITTYTLSTGHYSEAGVFTGFGSTDGIAATGYAGSGAVSVSGVGAYSLAFPSELKGPYNSVVFSYASLTFAVGAEPIRITSASLLGSMRTITTGGPLSGGSPLYDQGVLDIALTEGDSFYGPAIVDQTFPNLGPIPNNSYADIAVNTPISDLVGVNLNPNSDYTLSVAMASFYTFTRNTGDQHKYGITNEYGGFGSPFNFGNASFTYQALPEPTTLAAFGLGGLALLRKRAKKS